MTKYLNIVTNVKLTHIQNSDKENQLYFVDNEDSHLIQSSFI